MGQDDLEKLQSRSHCEIHIHSYRWIRVLMNKSIYLEDRTVKSVCDICVEPRTFNVQERALFCFGLLADALCLVVILVPVSKGFEPY